MNVDVVALAISIFALLVAGVALWYARQTAKDTHRQADAAQAELHRTYRPNLSVTLQDESGTGPDLRYEIRNDGHKDLDSVIVERPEVSRHVRYPVARMGTDYDDQAELGPLRIGEARDLLLRIGAATTPLPEFRVRITCRAGSDSWPVSALLKPRQPCQIF